MGIDLILKYKNKQVADLGRAYHYETDGEVLTDTREITKNMNKVLQDTREKLVLTLGYTPQNHEELTTMLQDLTEDLEALEEILIDTGQKLLLANILEDGELTAEKY